MASKVKYYISIRPSVILGINFNLNLHSRNVPGVLIDLNTVEMDGLSWIGGAFTFWNPSTPLQRTILATTMRDDIDFHIKEININFGDVFIGPEDFNILSKTFDNPGLIKLDIYIHGNRYEIECLDASSVIDSQYDQNMIDGLKVDPRVDIFLMYSVLGWDHIADGNINAGG